MIFLICRKKIPEIDQLGDVFFLQENFKINRSRGSFYFHITSHVYCLFLATKTFVYCRSGDIVIFYDHFIFTALYFNILNFLLPIRKVSVVAFPFIFIRHRGFIGFLHYLFFYAGVKASLRTFFICHSKEEIKKYSTLFNISEKKFVFVPYSTEFPQISPEEKPLVQGTYFFSGGASNRDYDTLWQVAKKMPKVHFVVACTPTSLPKESVPKNVTIFFDAYTERFANLLAHAAGVILLLRDQCVSAGQSVLLQAMSLQKPVIVTYSSGVLDYVSAQDVIFVRKSSDVIAAVRNIIRYPLRYDNMTRIAYNRYCKNFTHQRLAEKILKIIKENV